MGFAAAAASPPQLRGKSIIVSWGEQRSQRNVGEADFRSVAIQHDFRVYVSAAGRVLSRLTNANRRGSGSSEQIAGEGGSTRATEFTGQSMIVTRARSKGGARRITVEFDATFGSCRAEVVRAKQVGSATTISRSLITGRLVEIRSVTVSGASCAIQGGNVFGGE